MKNLPRIRFANLPTPVEPLPRLTAELGGPSLWIKRDDLTGLALGGNKTRKLEFLIAQAQEENARVLITAGAGQSNHCRQTAAAAAKFGLSCVLVLTGAPPAEPSGNLLLDLLLGAEIIWTEREKRDAVLQQTFQALANSGKRPFLIPYGGSNPIGAAAYAAAMNELMEQDFHPDWIVFPSSSGGTQAGMVVGARRTGLTAKILGISVDEPAGILQERVANLANQTAELLEMPGGFVARDILVEDAYIGGGYGVLSDLERDAVHCLASKEGILLDPVYTGRAAGGMLDLIRRDTFKPGETVLFWHTGGTPAVFSDSYRDIL